MSKPLIIATRGSALALAQSNMMKAAFEALSGRPFELRIIKTTGDKLQTAPMTQPSEVSTKGLFTKELELALLDGSADLAVHSLKDLPTELPEGLVLGAVSEREDVRDVLLVREDSVSTGIGNLPVNATIATSSTRRAAQIQALRPDVKVVPIRGNVGTRIKKLLGQRELAGTILARAGLNRLGIRIDEHGVLSGAEIPQGAKGFALAVEEMLPCVGQAAIGIEIRKNDPVMGPLCERLNHASTCACVSAERSFLRAMGGGCLSPVAAYATEEKGTIRIRAVALKTDGLRRAEVSGSSQDAEALGKKLAGLLG